MGNALIYRSHSVASTVSDLKLLGSAISAGFSSAGLVKMSDTGTIDWDAVSSLPANSSTIGTEMWRFNDSLQATKPIYIKVVYHKGIGDSLLMSFGVGSGTDGALNITGTYLSLTALTASPSTSYNDGTNPRRTLISGDGSGIYACINLDHQGPAGASLTRGRFVVDRFRNSDGSPSGNGLFVLVGTTTASVWLANAYDTVNNVTITSTPIAHIPCITPTGLSVKQVNGGIPLGIFYGFIPSVGIYRSKMLLAIPAADQSAMSQFDTTFLGSTRKYISHGIFSNTWDYYSFGVSCAQWWSD